MQTRQSPHDVEDHLQSVSNDPDGDPLEAARAAGEQHFQAGEAAIQGALSGDALSFLEANQQEGGQ